MDQPARGTPQLRMLNTRRVLSAVRDAGEPTRIAELAEMTALTRPTVAQIVAVLEEHGWLERHEPSVATGRPAARYALLQRRFMVFGADAGAHRAVVEVAGLDGRVRARRERRHDRRLGQEMLDLLGEMLQECLAETGLRAATMVAGTVATPGIVDLRTGRITTRHKLGDWTVEEVVDRLGAGTTDVSVENDANLAALAMRSVPDMPPTFLGLQWGQRLGAGIVQDGQLYRGESGAAGEVGSLLTEDPVTGQVRHLEEVVRVSRLPELGGVPEVSAEELLAAAGRGEQGAVEALRHGVAPLVRVVAPICLALDLRVITISGAIARGGPALPEALRDELGRHGAHDVECVLSPFLEDTVVRGAVGHAAESGWQRVLATAPWRSGGPSDEPGVTDR
ncbi:ROK family transcriptional regulator [Pseudactinotalea terrae]|uniref:ROK family transcriptional regulator n=1 Tax=Pseudactinotalea terrae TaxID=1743262 RepID=UPI0012E265B5|nr:ROK family transcriptional regulator [Pseudactinotalea terrae]